jgi:hypothetical protein
MTKANATIEQPSNGHIGHPAACMIENKRVLPEQKGCLIMAEPRFTFSVDNFVGKSV